MFDGKQELEQNPLGKPLCLSELEKRQVVLPEKIEPSRPNSALCRTKRYAELSATPN